MSGGTKSNTWRRLTQQRHIVRTRRLPFTFMAIHLYFFYSLFSLTQSSYSIRFKNDIGAAVKPLKENQLSGFKGKRRVKWNVSLWHVLWLILLLYIYIFFYFLLRHEKWIHWRRGCNYEWIKKFLFKFKFTKINVNYLNTNYLIIYLNTKINCCLYLDFH